MKLTPKKSGVLLTVEAFRMFGPDHYQDGACFGHVRLLHNYTSCDGVQAGEHPFSPVWYR